MARTRAVLQRSRHPGVTRTHIAISMSNVEDVAMARSSCTVEHRVHSWSWHSLSRHGQSGGCMPGCCTLSSSHLDIRVQIIQRDRLVACLHEHIDAEYGQQVRVYHSVEVDKVERCEDEEDEQALQVHWRGQEGRSGCIKAPFVARSLVRFHAYGMQLCKQFGKLHLNTCGLQCAVCTLLNTRARRVAHVDLITASRSARMEPTARC